MLLRKLAVLSAALGCLISFEAVAREEGRGQYGRKGEQGERRHHRLLGEKAGEGRGGYDGHGKGQQHHHRRGMQQGEQHGHGYRS